jgi:hypothetical protein
MSYKNPKPNWANLYMFNALLIPYQLIIFLSDLRAYTRLRIHDAKEYRQ